jgi:hypothetical protein
MHKLFSIIAGFLAMRVGGQRRDLADEAQYELPDLSQYGTLYEVPEHAAAEELTCTVSSLSGNGLHG